MKSSLLNKLNMESGDSVVDVDNIIPTMSLSPMDAEGDVLINDMVALESASTQLSSTLDAAETLVDKWVDSIVVADVLAPVAVSVIAQADSEAAKDVGDHVVSMEADDKSIWKKIKEKLIAIWQAFKNTFLRFWAWLKGFFVKTKTKEKEVDVKVSAAEKAFKEAKEEIKAEAPLTRVEFPCIKAWTIDNQPVNAKVFLENAIFFKKQFSLANASMFEHIRKQYDILKERAEVYEKEFARIATLNVSNTMQEQIQNKITIENTYASETERIRKFLNLNGKHPILGYYQVNGAGRMLPSTYDGEDMLSFTVVDGDNLVKGLHTLRFSMTGNKANYDRLETVAVSIIKKMEKMMNDLDLHQVNVRALRNELSFQTKMLTNTMMAIREFVGVASLNALVNGARLVFTIADKMKEANQQHSTSEA